MKLLMAIVQDDDAQRVISNLMSAGYSVTKLSSTGGFLRVGNTTLILGVSDDKIPEVMSVVEKTCCNRKQIATSPSPMPGAAGTYVPYPVEVMVGGATMFVLPVEQFKKV